MPDVGFGSVWWWTGFSVFVVAMLIIDIMVFHRRDEVDSLKKAASWVSVWISLALLFNVYLFFEIGTARALTFTTGYLIELSLSVDNIFVFLMIFRYFAVPAEFQHRVLFWGILGAVIMRAFMIFAGVMLIERFHWVIYVFGAFLIYTGYKMLTHGDQEVHPERNPVLKLLRRLVPMSRDYDGHHFLTVHNGRKVATPLMAVLVMIESTDVVFALDSIPAILAITQEKFIVYTSNIFAILGLRAMFFLLSGIMGRFVYLKTGLAIVLTFVGIKMVIADFFHIPIGVSLAIVAAVLLTSIVASLRKTAHRSDAGA